MGYFGSVMLKAKGSNDCWIMFKEFLNMRDKGNEIFQHKMWDINKLKDPDGKNNE